LKLYLDQSLLSFDVQSNSFAGTTVIKEMVQYYWMDLSKAKNFNSSKNNINKSLTIYLSSQSLVLNSLCCADQQHSTVCSARLGCW